MSCETDAKCKEYIDNINSTITEIWTNTESDIATIQLDNSGNVGRVVNKLLEKKQSIDSIRQGLSSRNRELQTIQERLDVVTNKSEQQEKNQESLEEMEKNNEKVIHYAQLLQSADGRQRNIPKNHQITLSHFLPVTLPFAKKIVIMTIPKENTVSYLRALIIVLFVTLCFLAHTVYKMARPLFQSGTIKVDSNVADQLAEIEKTPDTESSDDKPKNDSNESSAPKPTTPDTPQIEAPALAPAPESQPAPKPE